MAIPESAQQKSQLRQHMRQKLRGLHESSRPACDALHKWLGRHPDLKTIAVFSALPGEVNLLDLITRHPRITWVYPRVEGHTLVFHVITDPAAELSPGSFGILESCSSRPIIPEFEIDAFICPGLAFDQNGGRLGRGKGFYDRILANARPDALKIGVCFPCQLIANTFSEPHDIHMDAVIY